MENVKLNYSDLTDEELERIRYRVNKERKARKEGKQKPYEIFTDENDFFYFCDKDDDGKYFSIKVKNSDLKAEAGRFFMSTRSQEYSATKYTFKKGTLKGSYFLLDARDAENFRQKKPHTVSERLRVYKDENNSRGLPDRYYRYYFTQEQVESRINGLKDDIKYSEHHVEHAKICLKECQEALTSFMKQAKKLSALPRKKGE